MTAPLLTVRGLNVQFDTARGFVPAVENFDLNLNDGERLCIVGESGSGKSVAMLALLNLLPKSARVTVESCKYGDIDWKTIPNKEKERLIGKQIGMIFQEPFTSLNPCFTVGWQISEKLKLHQGLSGKNLKNEVINLLEQVGITDPEHRLNSFPHQLSGGMNQRVMIAMAVACKPRLLIADEPTTALDVTIQGQILDLIKRLQKEYGMGLVLITHDMGVVYEMADKVIVLYSGREVEQNTRDRIFSAPAHPYTKGLLDSLPERSIEGKLSSIPGSIPNIHEKPNGCIFHPRCNICQEVCTVKNPPHVTVGTGFCYCHFPLAQD